MIPQQLWTYTGWVLFTLFVLSIIVLSYALYRDYMLVKNKKSALPTLEIIQSEKEGVFSNDPSVATDLAGNTNKIPSRRSLRGAKAGPAVSAVEAKPSAFFDDDEDFTLTAGRD